MFALEFVFHLGSTISSVHVLFFVFVYGKVLFIYLVSLSPDGYSVHKLDY